MTGTDGYQTQKRKGDMSGQIRQVELLAQTVVILSARKHGIVDFVPLVCMLSTRQALSSRNVRSWSASSSSCHGEVEMLAYIVQLAKDTEFARIARGSHQAGEMSRKRASRAVRGAGGRSRTS